MQNTDFTQSTCTTRVYGYDADSNRTSLAAYPMDGNGNCSSTTTPSSSISNTYSQADQLMNSGYSYDPFGNTTAVPASGLVSGGAMSISYFTDDMVAQETQGTTEDAFTLDPLGRIDTQSTSQSGTLQSTVTNHYSDATDSPSWQATVAGGTTTWSRNIIGIDGNLAAIGTDTGSVTLQLEDLRGDIVATAPDSTADTGISSYFESTEFGVPSTDNSVSPQYAWLGAKRRSSGDLGGLTLMGARLYDPQVGRFLQIDPVPGGSLNSYDYAGQDPINTFDLNGECFLGICHVIDFVRHHWRGILNVVVAVSCVFTDGVSCAVAGTVAALMTNLRRGRHGKWHVDWEGATIDEAAVLVAFGSGKFTEEGLHSIYGKTIPKSVSRIVNAVEGAHFDVSAFLAHKFYDR